MRKLAVKQIENHEIIKTKVFAETCSMMIDHTEYESNQVVVNKILYAFPDNIRISDGRIWLPMACAIALFLTDKISGKDVRILYTADPLAMHQFSEDKQANYQEDFQPAGFTPIHLLCMQKVPKLSLVRYFSLRDPKAFQLCDKSGRCVLHLVARYSESLELLQEILQIDPAMTNSDSEEIEYGYEDGRYKPLGLLCARLEFHSMVSCLLEVDSFVEVVYDGIYRCIESHHGSVDNGISPGSRGETTLILFERLLKANPDVIKYKESSIFHLASINMKGKIGAAVLSLFHSKDNTGIKSVKIEDGCLPIHEAAGNSSVEVLRFLHQAYPESITMLTGDQNGLLHEVLMYNCDHSSAYVTDKVQYLLEQHPAMVHMVNNSGHTPLHCALRYLYSNGSSYIPSIKSLLNTDPTVARDKCSISNLSSLNLPLHILIQYSGFSSYFPMSVNPEVSGLGDCFRLVLLCYPSSANVKDTFSQSPYDFAVELNLNVYFIRLLLNDDPSIDPIKRRNLNYAARKEGMFLAFRALSTNLEPIIWSKIRYEDKNLLARIMSYL
jgi:ankyrin repeat protein